MTLAPTSEATPDHRIEEDLLGDLEKHGLRDGDFGENQPKLYFLFITHQARPFLIFFTHHRRPFFYLLRHITQMVNPGTFTGLRKQFLDSQQEIYAAAVKGKHVADAVANIQ